MERAATDATGRDDASLLGDLDQAVERSLGNVALELETPLDLVRCEHLNAATGTRLVAQPVETPRTIAPDPDANRLGSDVKLLTLGVAPAAGGELTEQSRALTSTGFEREVRADDLVAGKRPGMLGVVIDHCLSSGAAP